MSKRGKIDELYDFQKLEAQHKQVIGLITQFVEVTEKLQPVKVGFEGMKLPSEYLKGIKELTKEQQAQAKALLDSVKATDEFSKSQAKAYELQLKREKLRTQQVKTDNEVIKQIQLEERYTKQILKEKEKLAKQIEKEEKLLDTLTDDYKQLSLAYNEAANKAKNYALRFGETHPVTVQAIKDANAYGDQLKKLDALVGQHQRNVGNYTQATFALTQVLREAPAFANSFATGISAIGNNFPLLVDQYKSLSAQVGKFNAFKILASSLFSFQALLPLGFLLIQSYGKEISDFASSLFKSNKALSDAAIQQKANNELKQESIAGYAKEKAELDVLVASLQKEGISRKAKMDIIGELQSKFPGYFDNLNTEKNLNEQLAIAYEKASKGIMLKATAQAAQDLIAKNTTKRLELELEFNNKMVNSGKELEAALKTYGPGGRFEQYKKSIVNLNRIAAEQFSKDVNEIDKTNKHLLDTVIETNKQIDALGGKVTGGSGSGSKENQKNIDDLLEKQRKAAFELRKALLQDEIETQKALAESNIGGDSFRIKARETQLAKEKELAKLQTDFEIAEINARAAAEERQARKEIKDKEILAKTLNAIQQAAEDERQKLLLDSDNEVKALEMQTNLDIIAIRNKGREDEKKAIDELNAFIDKELDKQLTKEQKAAADRSKYRTSGIEGAMQAELSSLQKQFELGKITKEEYEASKLAIENKYRKESLLSEITYIEDILKLANLSADEREKQEKKLAEIKKQIRRDDYKDEVDYANRKYELEKSLKDRIKGLALQAYDAMREIAGFQFEDEKNRIQDQIDQLEEKKKKDIEVAQQTSANAQEAADKVALIEARANAERERLERNKRRIDQERAKFEKGAAAFNIGIQTIQDVFKIKAQAAVLLANPVTAPLAPLALAQIPFVAGAGALAAGLVLARPIPKYFRGKDKFDNYEGPAIVGDGGRSELIWRKDGAVEFTPSVPTLTHVGKDDIIFPDAQKILNMAIKNEGERAMSKAVRTSEERYWLQMTKELKGELHNVVRAINNKKEIHFQSPAPKDQIRMFKDGNKEYFKMHGLGGGW